jgi:hypothetical protein
MGHYQELRDAENVPAVPAIVEGKTLKDLHDEITVLNAEIAGAIDEVKQSQILKEFAQTVKASGAMGLMGLMTKIPDIMPELAPLFPALQKVVLVGEKQHHLTGEIIKQLGGNHGG